MKNKIIVSIFPTYACNHNCKFCYLYNNHDKTILDLEILEKNLKEISKFFTIDKFNLYGGEITVLPREYLKRLNDIIVKYNRVNYVTSNLYDVSKLDVFENASFSTSLNEERPDYEYVKSILKKGIDLENLTVLSMVTPSLLKKESKNVLLDYNNLGIRWLSFIKYYPSINTGDLYNVTQDEYEQFLINILKCYVENRKQFDYNLCLETGLQDCLRKVYPIATNDQCIRISPDGKFGAIYYNNENLEYFKWYENLNDYIMDVEKERIEYIKKCGHCCYYGNCWTEHLTRLKCDGCKNLLNFARTLEDERI